MNENKTNEIFEEVVKEVYPPQDTSKFKPLNADDLIDILGLTIKKDEINKLLAFLAQLSAYSEDSQINISFNAPSSTGKSFIPTEIAGLFPKEDVIEVGYCSPTAFFHDVGHYDKEKEGYIVDLSRKILIFLDQPHTLLLQHLRPFLSHDRKEIRLKITDKSQKAGLRTKNVFLIGYPAVVFCTAGLHIDEQEATRFLLLSPETSFEKLREAILEKIKKEKDKRAYLKEMEADPRRVLLKQRILAIKEEQVSIVNLSNPMLVEKLFFERAKKVKPRHQRDIGRLISLIKIFALLNVWHREKIGNAILANDDDINEAFKAWDVISESQELNLPPYVFDLYHDVIVDTFNNKNKEVNNEIKAGLTKQEIFQKHYTVYGRFLPDWQYKQIIPMLETSGLIMQEQNPLDKRQTLIYPTANFSIYSGANNSEVDGGVEVEDPRET
ncbi:hypothetical protein C4559_06465 [Candidatus Microgenomates bacterium]|nr:MAG: hypothetical protein C4559_06465 [Candidatus Microgenomates bacterium]